MAILSVMMSCKKTSYVAVFDKTPQERVADKINLVSTTLTGAPNGWIATLPTFAGGGYSFYFNFDNQQNVTMYADLNDQSATTVAKSNYRVKQDIGIELVFDTYNYISMLDDPNAAIFGGASKIGFSSDIEFTYDRSTADSIVFIGKKYRQPFKLVKATAQQKAAYESAGLKTGIDKFKNFFLTNQFPYIEVTSGSAVLKVAISPNITNALTTGKRIDLTGVLADGTTVISKNQKFSLNLNGADVLNEGLVWQGITFVRLAWKDVTTLALYDTAGKEYIVKNNAQPILNINLLWGTKYNALRGAYKTINPGTTAKGAAILNYYYNNLTPAFVGFSFNYGHITLSWNRVNQRFLFDGRCTQTGPSETAGWVTNITYNYTVNPDGSYKFTVLSPASGGYVANVMTELDKFLKNNDVLFDYYSDNGVVYGKMSSVQDPTIVMTFALQ
ncbi:hypothetical protein D3C73_849850 [compost metagenome]